MVKYFFRRFFRGCISVVIAIALIMMMVFSWLDDTLIFAEDEQYVKLSNNQRTLYMYQKWEEYDYLDYVPYTDWLNQLVASGELSEEERADVVTIGRTPERDSDETAAYVARFTEEYEALGYTVVRLDAVMATPNRVATGGTASLFAYQNTPLVIRLWNFFTGIFEFDNINYVEEDVGERGLTFTLYDPAYGGEKFSPAIIGNGTYHKYLLYFDNRFPYIHQNFLTMHLGTSYSVNKGVDAFETMIQPQGNYVRSTTYYPSGEVQNSADDLHSATYLAGTLEAAGFTRGALISEDGFMRCLDTETGSEYAFDFTHREGGEVTVLSTLRFAGRVSIACLRDYPAEGSGGEGYYMYEDGTLRSPFLDVSDGLDSCAAPELCGWSEDAGCAAIALELAPIFIADALNVEALEALENEGITVYYAEDGALRSTAA